jgi:hypothetical protein
MVVPLVSVRQEADGRPSPLTRGVLFHEAVLAPGVRLAVDLTTPDRWRSDSTHPPSWVRLAVVEALDRWLPLPLDQGLVDAERAVVRGRAARALPDQRVRSAVLGDALQLARQASGGLVGYLQSLGSRRRPVPAGLGVALDKLAAGYAELLTAVQGGADQELAAVVDTWRALAARLPTDGDATVVVRGLEQLRRRRRRSSMIDPRQLRSRVVALSTDPELGEVTLADAQVGGRPAVHVSVPVYRCALDQPDWHRLLVRIMDETSDEPRGQGVLTATRASRRGARTVSVEGVVPLSGPRVGRMRADVFDLLSEVPPVSADTDETLRQTRRATVLLGEWRRLVAVARLPAAGLAPASYVRELAHRLAPDGDHRRPLFVGGPTAADLDRLADLGDEEILRRARVEVGRQPPGLFAMVRGAGSPLVAELAAVRTARAG